jgi:hypothetical protein
MNIGVDVYTGRKVPVELVAVRGDVREGFLL